MQWQIQLVHAEAGRRVVQATAWEGERSLGSALGEGATAEEAEDRAVERLQRRLGSGSAAVLPAVGPVRPAPSASPRPAPQPPSPLLASEPPQAAFAATADPAPPPTDVPPAGPLEGPEPPADPEDWSDELAQLELELRRLGWGREQEAAYLERVFGHPSRGRLTRYADLVAYLEVLRRSPIGSDPSGLSAPLRRRDLLEQSDELLRQLHWDAAQGRAFLERHFALISRQQLSDEQLLRFNLLLEEEASASAAGEIVVAPPADAGPDPGSASGSASALAAVRPDQ